MSGRVGYVLKMYPRFSETFVVTEILAMQRLGVDLEIFSLRPPTDGRFHEPRRAPGTGDLPPASPAGQRSLADAAQPGSQFDDLGGHLDDLLSVDDGRRPGAGARPTGPGAGISHLHAHFASVSAVVARLAARMAGITYSVTPHAKDIFHEDVDSAALRRIFATRAWSRSATSTTLLRATSALTPTASGASTTASTCDAFALRATGATGPP